MVEKTLEPIVESGNPMFNINEAEPVVFTDSIVEEKLDFTKIDEARFNPKTNSIPAQSAVTPEDLAFEAALQRTHMESALPPARTEEVVKEKMISNFLGDYMENYQPAKTLNELEQQVFACKTSGADSIEASEEIIRFYTKDHYPEDTGYFIYKNVKVFIPGFIKSYVNSDSQNLNMKLRGHL